MFFVVKKSFGKSYGGTKEQSARILSNLKAVFSLDRNNFLTYFTTTDQKGFSYSKSPLTATIDVDISSYSFNELDSEKLDAIFEKITGSYKTDPWWLFDDDGSIIENITSVNVYIDQTVVKRIYVNDDDKIFGSDINTDEYEKSFDINMNHSNNEDSSFKCNVYSKQEDLDTNYSSTNSNYSAEYVSSQHSIVESEPETGETETKETETKDPKLEEPKPDEPKPEDPKPDEPKPDEPKPEDPETK